MATPTTHPKPDLPEATWAAIRAAVEGILASSPGNAPGFVAVAKACRAARRDGRIPNCSNQQLDAALKYLADAGQLGTHDGDDSTPEPAPAPPASDPLRININRFLDVVYDEAAGRARVLVDGKPFLHCAFVVANIDPDNQKNNDIGSIDELAANLEHDARVLEGTNVRNYLTPAEEVLAHASNLQAWVENDYDTRLLHSNIAFPLLKELAKNGDEKATRALNAEIETKLRDGTLASRLAILESCGDLIPNLNLIIPLLYDSSPIIFNKALPIIHRLARENNEKTKDVISAKLENVFLRVDYKSQISLLTVCGDLIRDPGLPARLLNAGDIIADNAALDVLGRLAREGNSDARRYIDTEISTRFKSCFIGQCSTLIEKCGDLIQNPDLLIPLVDDEHLIYAALPILGRLAREGNSKAISILDTYLRSGTLNQKSAILHECGDLIQDPLLLVPLLDDEIDAVRAFEMMVRLIRAGNYDARSIFKTEITKRYPIYKNKVKQSLLDICGDLLRDDLSLSHQEIEYLEMRNLAKRIFPNEISQNGRFQDEKVVNNMLNVGLLADQVVAIRNGGHLIPIADLERKIEDIPALYAGLIVHVANLLEENEEKSETRIMEILARFFLFLNVRDRDSLFFFLSSNKNRGSRIIKLVETLPENYLIPCLDFVSNTMLTDDDYTISNILNSIRLPSSQMAKLACCPSGIVRLSLASNPYLSEQAIYQLGIPHNDYPFEDEVREALFENRTVDVELQIIRTNNEELRDDKRFSWVLARLSKIDDPAVRLEVAKQPELLNAAWDDGWGYEITVDSLCDDPDPAIADAAKEFRRMVDDLKSKGKVTSAETEKKIAELRKKTLS